MDDINKHDFVLPEYPISTKPTPQTILEDHSNEFYRICWTPTEAGIVTEPPRLVRKQELAEHYPHVVATWEARQRKAEESAKQTEEKFLVFSGWFLKHKQDEPGLETLQCRVDCDQSLLPGTRIHWGEIRSCEVHPRTRTDTSVCKGCRVSHYAQESSDFDRHLIMARGARVSVCELCAATAVDAHGVGYRDCVCDSRWTCFRCREAELVHLAKVRETHVEGRCGMCLKAGGLVQHMDFCLYCRKQRIYAAPSQDTFDAMWRGRTIEEDL